MLCAHCDQPIRDGQPYDRLEKFSPSAGGVTMYRHKGPCKHAQKQTAPVTGPRRHR